MKEFTALVSIMAENESDFKEQLDALDGYELEWWKEGRDKGSFDEMFKGYFQNEN